MTACIVGLGTVVVLIGWHGPVRARRVAGRLPVTGTLAWVAVLVAGCLWELGALPAATVADHGLLLPTRRSAP